MASFHTISHATTYFEATLAWDPLCSLRDFTPRAQVPGLGSEPRNPGSSSEEPGTQPGSQAARLARHAGGLLRNVQSADRGQFFYPHFSNQEHPGAEFLGAPPSLGGSSPQTSELGQGLGQTVKVPCR